MLEDRPHFLCRSCNGLLTKSWQACSQPGSTPLPCWFQSQQVQEGEVQTVIHEEACSTPNSQGGLLNQRVQFYITKLPSICIVPIYTSISNIQRTMLPWQLSNRTFGECFQSLANEYFLSDRTAGFLNYFSNYKLYLNIFLVFLSLSVNFMFRFLRVIFFLFLFIFLLFLGAVCVLKIKAFL